MPPRRNAGRLFDLQRETKVPEPYVLTPEIAIQPLTKAQYRALADSNSDEEQDRIVLGDSYDAVVELFEDKPFQLWQAFSSDLNKHLFGPGVDDVEGKSEPSSE